MLRQYLPQRFRYERLPNGRPMPVGTLPVGTIFRVPMTSGFGKPSRLRKYVVEVWLPRRIAGWKPGLRGHTKLFEDCFVANGSWQARVRCLSDGTRTVMPDHVIRRWVNADVRHVEASHVPVGTPERIRHRYLALRGADGGTFGTAGSCDPPARPSVITIRSQEDAMRRIRLTDRVRLPDGSVATVAQALKDGALTRVIVWQEQHDETHGNTVGYRPRWRTGQGYQTSISKASNHLRACGALANYPNGGLRLVRRETTVIADGTADYGYVHSQVLKTREQLAADIRRYGDDGVEKRDRSVDDRRAAEAA